MVRLLAAVWLLALLPESHAQPPCTPQVRTRLAAEASRLQNSLRKVKSGDMDTNVPSEAQRLIPQFRGALVRLTEAVVACHETSTGPAAIQSELATLLHANPPQPPPGASVMNGDPRYVEYLSFDTYGSNLLIHVTRPTASTLAIESSFRIGCGDDTVLVLFASDESRWKELLVWQALPYKEISGAFGDFFVYSILPANPTHGLRVLAAHGRPWCTSRFSGFDMDLLAPQPTGGKPRVVWHTARGYSRGDAPTRLKATSDGFELRLNATSFDINTFEVPVIYRYQLTGDHLKRVEPIATNGRGFVEEWLEMPWEEAVDQIAPDAATALKPIHDQFNAPAKATDKSFLDHTNGPVRACSGGNHEFQVEVDSTLKTIVVGLPGGRSQTQPSTYFHIRETGNGYQLQSATHTADPRCNGPDLMPPSSR